MVASIEGEANGPIVDAEHMAGPLGAEFVLHEDRDALTGGERRVIAVVWFNGCHDWFSFATAGLQIRPSGGAGRFAFVSGGVRFGLAAVVGRFGVGLIVGGVVIGAGIIGPFGQENGPQATPGRFTGFEG